MSAPLPPPFTEALRVWARVALLSFGGPAGQVAVMHRILVEEKRWVEEPRFLHALNFCMLLPGPEAQQLATWLGWYLHGVRGGLVAGLLFILPGFVAILLLSVLYVLFRETPLIGGLLLGLKAAVLALVVLAVRRLATRALATPALKGAAILAFVALALLDIPFPAVVAAAAAFGWGISRLRPVWLGDALVPDEPWQPDAAPRPDRTLRTVILGIAVWLLPLALVLPVLGPGHVLVDEALFFGKVALVTFGGAYAVLAYVAQQAVELHHWLLPGEMLDGLGMAESTPGPLIQVVQFVGFLGAWRNPEPFSPLLAGVLGSLVTTWAVFVPCFVFIFAGAAHVERLRHHRGAAAALRGVTAGVLGMMASLALWFGSHVLFAQHRTWDPAGLELSLPVADSVVWPAVLLVVLSLGLAGLKWSTGRLVLAGVLAGMVLGPA